MTIYNELLHITKELYNNVNKNVSENRDETIETIHSLLDKRQKLLQQLPVEASAEDKDTIIEILQYDKKLSMMISNSMVDIKKDILKIKDGEKTNSRYNNPYGDISIDGMFLDKKS